MGLATTFYLLGLPSLGFKLGFRQRLSNPLIWNLGSSLLQLLVMFNDNFLTLSVLEAPKLEGVVVV